MDTTLLCNGGRDICCSNRQRGCAQLCFVSGRVFVYHTIPYHTMFRHHCCRHHRELDARSLVHAATKSCRSRTRSYSQPTHVPPTRLRHAHKEPNSQNKSMATNRDGVFAEQPSGFDRNAAALAKTCKELGERVRWRYILSCNLLDKRWKLFENPFCSGIAKIHLEIDNVLDVGPL